MPLTTYDTSSVDGRSSVPPPLISSNHTDLRAVAGPLHYDDVKVFHRQRLNSTDSSAGRQWHLTSNGTKPTASSLFSKKFHNHTGAAADDVDSMKKLRISPNDRSSHQNRSEFWLNDNFTLFDFDQNGTAFLQNRSQADMSQPQIADTSTGQTWAVHLAVGVAAGTTCLVMFLALLLYLYKHKQKGIISSSNDSQTKSYQETRWDDISLHWIEPRDFRKDSFDDLASMENDSYLNSLDALMFQRVWKTNEPIGQINNIIDPTGLSTATQSLPADRSDPNV